MRAGLVLGEVWTGLRRNLSVVISVILVTFVSLTFVGAAILMQLQVQQMKTFWYDRAQVAIYLCTQYDESATCSASSSISRPVPTPSTSVAPEKSTPRQSARCSVSRRSSEVLGPGMIITFAELLTV